MSTKKSAPTPAKTVGKPKTAGRSSKKMESSWLRSDIAVKFFVADDIRTDSEQKSMLIGFYPDNVVILKAPPEINPTKTKPIAISGLTFMFTISAPEGRHRARVALQMDATGKLKNVAETDFEILPGKTSFNIIARAQPFFVHQFGVQPLEVVVDGHEFTGSIDIRRIDASNIQ